MQTDLTISKDYEEVFYVICKKPLDGGGWLFHHKYADLGKAKSGLKDLMNRNTWSEYKYEYKIKKIAITAKDIITDQTLPQFPEKEEEHQP